jgi:hypothetical protein
MNLILHQGDIRLLWEPEQIFVVLCNIKDTLLVLWDLFIHTELQKVFILVGGGARASESFKPFHEQPFVSN